MNEKQFSALVARISKSGAAFVADVQVAAMYAIEQSLKGNTNQGRELVSAVPARFRGLVVAYLCAFGYFKTEKATPLSLMYHARKDKDGGYITPALPLDEAGNVVTWADWAKPTKPKAEEPKAFNAADWTKSFRKRLADTPDMSEAEKARIAGLVKALEEELTRIMVSTPSA